MSPGPITFSRCSQPRSQSVVPERVPATLPLLPHPPRPRPCPASPLPAPSTPPLSSALPALAAYRVGHVSAAGWRHAYLHHGLPHLHPLIDVLVEPDDADGVAAVQVAVVTVPVPPAGGVEARAVRRARVVVGVARTERRPVGVAQRVGRVAAVTGDAQPVVGALRRHAEVVVFGPPGGAAGRAHLDAQPVRRAPRELVQRRVAEPEVGVEAAEAAAILGPRPVEEDRSVDAPLDDGPRCRPAVSQPLKLAEDAARVVGAARTDHVDAVGGQAVGMDDGHSGAVCDKTQRHRIGGQEDTAWPDRRTGRHGVTGQVDRRTGRHSVTGQADRKTQRHWTGGQEDTASTDRRTGRHSITGQADRRTGGQADRRTGGQADRRTGRHSVTGRRTGRHSVTAS